MKKLILACAILLGCTAYSQETGFRLNEREFFTLSMSYDPVASHNEKGTNFALDAEYAGLIYTKIGVESFRQLEGGYTDFHGAIGVNFTSGRYEKFRYYTGVRVAEVFRDGGHATNIGGEAGIDYNITPNFTIGVFGTYIYRNEQKVIFNWHPEYKASGFIRVGYKWYWKNRRPY